MNEKALRLLDEIGGSVAEDEVAHHLGGGAVVELFEAETEGLVASRTYFELTDAGRERLGVEGADRG